MTDLYRYHDGTAYRAVLLATEGRKNLTLVVVDAPVRLLKVPKAHGRYLKPIPYTGRCRQVANAYLRAGKNLGITTGAKRALEKLK